MFTKEYLSEIHGLLNHYLSDINVLYTKVRNFHYNATGIEFFEIHEKFEEYYTMLQSEMDEVAERILMLDLKPFGSLEEYLKHSQIKEIPSKDYTFKEISTTTIADFEHIVKSSLKIIKVASDANDAGTADLFTRNVQNYEKAIWMLKAFMKNQK